MSLIAKNVLKDKFSTSDIPTQQDFFDLIDEIYTSNFNIKVIGDYSNLSEAVATIGNANQTVLLIDSETFCIQNTTVPSNIQLILLNSGRIDQRNFTLNIQGNFLAGLHPVFVGYISQGKDDAGQIIINSSVVKEVYPQWWGAVGDGITDDTYAFQSALNSAPITYIDKTRTDPIGNNVNDPSDTTYYFKWGYTKGVYVTWPFGIYAVNLVVNRKNTKINGIGGSSSGRVYSKLVPYNPDLPVLITGDDSDTIEGSRFENIVIESTGPNGTGTVGLWVRGGTYNCYFNNVECAGSFSDLAIKFQPTQRWPISYIKWNGLTGSTSNGTPCVGTVGFLQPPIQYQSGWTDINYLTAINIINFNVSGPNLKVLGMPPQELSPDDPDYKIPTDGDAYLIDYGATGSWTNKDAQQAVWNSVLNDWVYSDAPYGLILNNGGGSISLAFGYYQLFDRQGIFIDGNQKLISDIANVDSGSSEDTLINIGWQKRINENAAVYSTIYNGNTLGYANVHGSKTLGDIITLTYNNTPLTDVTGISTTPSASQYFIDDGTLYFNSALISHTVKVSYYWADHNVTNYINGYLTVDGYIQFGDSITSGFFYKTTGSQWDYYKSSYSYPQVHGEIQFIDELNFNEDYSGYSPAGIGMSSNALNLRADSYINLITNTGLRVNYAKGKVYAKQYQFDDSTSMIQKSGNGIVYNVPTGRNIFNQQITTTSSSIHPDNKLVILTPTFTQGTSDGTNTLGISGQFTGNSATTYEIQIDTVDNPFSDTVGDLVPNVMKQFSTNATTGSQFWTTYGKNSGNNIYWREKHIGELSANGGKGILSYNGYTQPSAILGPFPTIIGRTYKLSLNMWTTTAISNTFIYATDIAGDALVDQPFKNIHNTINGSVITYYFVASSTNSYININGSTHWTAGSYISFDNVALIDIYDTFKWKRGTDSYTIDGSKDHIRIIPDASYTLYTDIANGITEGVIVNFYSKQTPSSYEIQHVVGDDWSISIGIPNPYEIYNGASLIYKVDSYGNIISNNGKSFFNKVSADRGDNSVTLTVGTDTPIQLFNTTLTNNRTVTLSTTNAVNGDWFRIVRNGLGAKTLDVGGLKVIPNSTAAFVDVMFNGTSWVLTGYGTL